MVNAKIFSILDENTKGRTLTWPNDPHTYLKILLF